MAGRLINVVYKDMREEALPPLAPPGVGATVVWSRAEVPRADAYFYLNSYGLDPASPHHRGKPKLLYISEPLCVHPIQYTRGVWRQFDFLFTWNDAFRHPRFITIKRPFAGFPHAVSWNQSETVEESGAELLRRPRALCMINNNKKSLIAGELYSLRRNTARWFHEDGRIPFDVFAQIPFNLPNYRGPAAAGKIETLRRYRFALCLENLYLPVWSCGYVTEKIFDAFFALTVPVYLGCFNVEQHLPADCFIDYRRFGSPQALREHLEAMTDEEYLGFVDGIRRYLREARPLESYHWNRVYERIAGLLQRIDAEPQWAREVQAQPLPPDYPASERRASALARFYLQCLLLRFPGLVRWGMKLLARRR